MDSHMGHGTKKTSRLEVNVERYFNANFFYGDRGVCEHIGEKRRGDAKRRCDGETDTGGHRGTRMPKSVMVLVR